MVTLCVPIKGYVLYLLLIFLFISLHSHPTCYFSLWLFPAPPPQPHMSWCEKDTTEVEQQQSTAARYAEMVQAVKIFSQTNYFSPVTVSKKPETNHF